MHMYPLVVCLSVELTNISYAVNNKSVSDCVKLEETMATTLRGYA